MRPRSTLGDRSNSELLEVTYNTGSTNVGQLDLVEVGNYDLSHSTTARLKSYQTPAIQISSNYTQMMELPSTFTYKGWSVRYRFHAHLNTATTPVVFVHGTPWSSVVFEPVIEILLAQGRHPILVYDLPGYGQSQEYASPEAAGTDSHGFKGDTSIKFQSETLAALLNHLKINGTGNHPKPAVIAHDIGGALVLRTHLIHKVEFSSMLLMDANAVLPWGDGFYKLVRSQPRPFLELPPAIFEAMLRAVIRSACHDPRVLLAEWEDRLAEPWLNHAHGQRNFIRQIAQANDQDVDEMLRQDLYPQIQCDAKVIWGESDQWIPKHKIEEFVNKAQGAAREVVYIPNAGHLVMLDQPARVAVEIVNWLH